MRLNPKLKIIQHIFRPEWRLRVRISFCSNELYRLNIDWSTTKVKRIMKNMSTQQFRQNFSEALSDEELNYLYDIFWKEVYLVRNQAI